MELLSDPQAWLSFWMLAVLEIVLGIDNIIFLAVLVDRLPRIQRRSGRLMGLGFAMVTRIGLLLSITWLTTVRHPLLSWSGHTVTVRNLILGAGGTLLIIKSVMEIRDAVRAGGRPRRPGRPHGYWLVILQIGVIDIIFSLDSVFTAVGLASRVEVMIAAIVVSVAAMMAISSVVSLFIDRYPAVKLLALAFLVLIGASLVAESFNFDLPKRYLYIAMGAITGLAWIGLRLRRGLRAGA